MHREVVGMRQLTLELDAGATIEMAWAALVDLHPRLAAGREAVRFARNGEYAGTTEPLSDGDELACIPPVSGGSHAAPSGACSILELREASFGPEILVELIERLGSDEDGGVAAFLGRTRRTAGTPAPGQETEAQRHVDESVAGLEYEAHDAMVERVLATIAEEIEERFGVRRLAIVHRIGSVPLGEVSVAVVACAPHRDAAFRAARWAIDETKARAPIWKAERFASGRVWVGEPARAAASDEAGVASASASDALADAGAGDS
jgi:molybdopterin synthase catalytic subunit